MVCDLCQDGNTNAQTITEVKDLELNQFSVQVVLATVEQTRQKANMVAQGDGKFYPGADPKIPPYQKNNLNKVIHSLYMCMVGTVSE